MKSVVFLSIILTVILLIGLYLNLSYNNTQLDFQETDAPWMSEEHKYAQSVVRVEELEGEIVSFDIQNNILSLTLGNSLTRETFSLNDISIEEIDDIFFIEINGDDVNVVPLDAAELRAYLQLGSSITAVVNYNGLSGFQNKDIRTLSVTGSRV